MVDVRFNISIGIVCAVVLVGCVKRPADAQLAGESISHITGLNQFYASIKGPFTETQSALLSKEGVDILGRDVPNDVLHIGLNLRQKQSLEAAGIKFLSADEERKLYKNVRPECRALDRSELFVGDFAVDERYTDLYEFWGYLKEWGSNPAYKNIYRNEIIGKAVDGTPIYAIKISDNVATRERHEPVLVFDSLYHAREVMTLEVNIDMIEFLLDAYVKGDARVKAWIDATEIWIVPVVNPSGLKRVWGHDGYPQQPGQRKSFDPRKRLVPDSMPPETFYYEVDLNRNFAATWGACNGSTSDRAGETYHGSGPASEPETKAIDNLMKRINPIVSLSYHSTGEAVLFPLSCQSAMSPNRDVFKYIAEDIARRLPRDCLDGTYSAGESWQMLYGQDGDSYTHFHLAHNIYSFLIEMSGNRLGFHPDFGRWRQKSVEKMRLAWITMLELVWSHSVRGMISSEGLDHKNAYAMLTPIGDVGHRVKEAVNLELAPDFAKRHAHNPCHGIDQGLCHPITSDRTFNFMAKPGRYQVLVAARGYNSVTTEIEVKDCRPSMCAPFLNVTMQKVQSGRPSTIKIHHGPFDNKM